MKGHILQVDMIKIFCTKNENATYQNLWDATEGVLRQKFTALNVLEKEERSKKAEINAIETTKQ